MVLRRSRWMVPVVVSLAAIAVACAPMPPGELSPSDPADGLRVMTYNLLGAQADAAVFSEHAGWAARVDQLRPDVIVVQEAQSEDVAALRDLTTEDYTVAAYQRWACDLKGNPEGVAILVRSSITVANGGGTNVGESCADPTVRRVLVWADLQMQAGRLRIYGTHLTSGGGAAAGSRASQIRLIRERIAVDDATGNDRWLLAGDMNFTPGSADHRLMLTGDTGSVEPGTMLDTFAELRPEAADPAACPAHSDVDLVAQTFLLANPDIVRACGYTAGWVKDSNPLGCDLLSLCTSWQIRAVTSVTNRIDMVLRPEAGPVHVDAVTVPNRADADFGSPGAEWFRLSDHLPYVVDLTVSPAAPAQRSGT